MLKVQLKKNLRYFDYDDSDFSLQVGTVKELPEKHMKSYSIKLFLFTGKLQVVEGDVLFNYKSSVVYLSKLGLFGKEGNKYFTKDLEMDTFSFIEEKDVPSYALSKLNGIEPVAVILKPVGIEKPAIKPKEEYKFESMTKKEILAFAKKKNILIDDSLAINDLRYEIKDLLKAF